MFHVRRWFLAFCLAAAVLPAQTDLSTIRGTATDPAGAVVPGAKITVADIGTNLSREAQTNNNGDFEIPYLTPGTYRLTATASGFRNFVAENLILVGREIRRLDIKFELGTVGQEVTVTAGAAVISTEGSQVASGFNKNAFVDSPLSQSFFPQAYMTTLPSIQTDNGGWGLRFAGQPPTPVGEALDGVSNDGAVNLVQNMNDFEELQVVAVNNSAEFSRVANFGMTGRSGTNQFHGKVYYDFINSALNARNFFTPTKTPYKEHRGGTNVSGPIIKDRTFFYAAYSLVRIPSSTFYNRNVPPAEFRRGDFSPLLNQTRPVPVRDPLSGQPFAGNIIPQSRFNATAVKIQDSYIPAPNQGGAGARSNNFGFLHRWPVDLYRWDSVTDRIDHKFSEKNTIFARYINRLTPYVLAGAFPEVGTWTRKRNHHSIVVSDTHVFSPTLVNTARWGWIKDYFIDGEQTDGFTPVTGDTVVKAIGLQGVNPRGLSAMGFPTVNITGVTLMRINPGGVNLDRNDFSYADSVTWSKGSHVVKFGGEMKTFRDFNGQVPEGTYGNFTFNGSLLGEAYAEFLLGLPFSSSRIDPFNNRVQNGSELGFFLTDTFKVNRKLTLDYGLRWDYFGATSYEDGLQYNWDRQSGNVVVPQPALAKVHPAYTQTGLRVVTGEVVPSPSKANFRPRLGVAYRLQDRMVLRGGYGLFTETLGNLHRVQGGGPFQISDTYFNAIQNGQPLFQFPNPFPSGAGTLASQSIAGYPLETDNGVVHQFNVSIEREIRDLGFRVSYIGSRSRGLNYNLSINKPQPSLTAFAQSRRPYPQFVNATFPQSDGRAEYNSMQFEVQRKRGNLIFDFHYTLASNLADYLNLENPYNHGFWNRDQYTSRHRAVINLTYDLPFGRGRRHMSAAPAVVDHVLGGWQLNWISYFQSGQYSSPSFSGADPSNTNTTGGLPDRISDGNLPPDRRVVDRWFDAAAFVPPPAGRFGNSGVNILEGPGLNLHHLGVIKEFKLTERLRLNYQAMITDIFNTPHFGFPANNITVPLQVARLTGSAGGGAPREKSSQREIQMRLRLEF